MFWTKKAWHDQVMNPSFNIDIWSYDLVILSNPANAFLSFDPVEAEHISYWHNHKIMSLMHFIPIEKSLSLHGYISIDRWLAALIGMIIIGLSLLVVSKYILQH